MGKVNQCIFIIATSLLLAGFAFAENDELSGVLMEKNTGCLKGLMNQFGRYIGDWSIADQTLQQDGKTWTKGNGARWNFTCVGNGIAVQDFWMPNASDAAPVPGVGTNLRIYDPKTEQWEITWAATLSPGKTHIRAKQDSDGSMVMNYVAPAQNPPRRIIFFTPDDDGWNWEMQLSFDNEKTWTPVYKIRATPLR